jgi:hypothetical protein
MTHAWLMPFLAGLSLVGYALIQLHRARSVGRWLKVPATVIDSAVGEIPTGNAYVDYFPAVRFRYRMPSGEYESDRFTVAHQDYRHFERARAQTIVNQHPCGANVEAFVAPLDHRVAVLRREVSSRRYSHWYACLLGGLIVCGLSIATRIALMA